MCLWKLSFFSHIKMGHEINLNAFVLLKIKLCIFLISELIKFYPHCIKVDFNLLKHKLYNKQTTHQKEKSFYKEW